MCVVSHVTFIDAGCMLSWAYRECSCFWFASCLLVGCFCLIWLSLVAFSLFLLFICAVILKSPDEVLAETLTAWKSTQNRCELPFIYILDTRLVGLRTPGTSATICFSCYHLANAITALRPRLTFSGTVMHTSTGQCMHKHTKNCTHMQSH